MYIMIKPILFHKYKLYQNK